MHPIVSWEYHIEKTTRSSWSGKDKTDINELLARMGRDGWELTAVVPNTTTGTLMGYHFFFKRQRF